MEFSEWEVPPDPDFEQLAKEGWAAWERDRPKLVAFDTETSGYAWDDEAFCVTCAWEGTGGPVSAYFELARYDSFPMVAHVLQGADALVGHNIKFDLHRVRLIGGLTRKELHDTEALAHLEDEHRKKGLKELAVTVLKYDDTIQVPIKSKPGEFKAMPREKWELEQAKKWAKKEHGLGSVTEVGYDLLPRGTVVPYALKDAEFTLALYSVLRPKIEAFEDAWGLYLQEMELTRMLIDLEASGMGVDQKYVSEQIKEYGKRIVKCELVIEGIVGKPVRTGKMPEKEKKNFFNPQSNDQVKKFFTSAGFNSDSYDEEHLRKIDHPLAAALLELRSDQKILGTYFMALKKETIDGVFHPSIRQHGTVTGRTSSGAQKGDA